MSSIFDFFGLLVNWLRTTVEGVLNFAKTLLWGVDVLFSWEVFVPSTVFVFMSAGIIVTVILNIIGRNHSK